MPITLAYQPSAQAVGQVALEAGKGQYQQYLDQLQLQQETLAQRDRMQVRDIEESQRAQRLGLAVGQQNLAYQTQNANQRFVTGLYADRFQQIAGQAFQGQQAQQQRAFDAERIQYQTQAQIYRDNLAQAGRESLAAQNFDYSTQLTEQRGEIDYANAYDLTQLRTDEELYRNDALYRQRVDRAREAASKLEEDTSLRDFEKEYLQRKIQLEAATGSSLMGPLRPPTEPPPLQQITPDGSDQPIMSASGEPLYFHTDPTTGRITLPYNPDQFKLQERAVNAQEALKTQNENERDFKQGLMKSESETRMRLDAYKTYQGMEPGPERNALAQQFNLGISEGGSTTPKSTQPQSYVNPQTGKINEIGDRATVNGNTGVWNGEAWLSPAEYANWQRMLKSSFVDKQANGGKTKQIPGNKGFSSLSGSM